MKGRIEKKGDFVRLITGSMEIGEIISIDKNKNFKQIQIKLLNSGDVFYYDKTEIVPIHTNEYHLIKLGFEKVCINEHKCFFELLSIVISAVVHNSFIPGYYLLDPRELTNQSLPYYAVNPNIFYEKYLNLNNINDVFSYLKENNILIMNAKKVLLSSN